MDTNAVSNLAATQILVWGIVGIWILMGFVVLLLGLRLVYILIWKSEADADFSWQTSGGTFGAGGSRRRVGRGLVTFIAFLFSLTALGGIASMTGPTVVTVLQPPPPKDPPATKDDPRPISSSGGTGGSGKQRQPSPLASDPKGRGRG